MEWSLKDFKVTDDKAVLSVRAVRHLYAQTDWAKDYSDEKIQRLVKSSLWLCLVKGTVLIGLVRAVTDEETHCWISDFIIDRQWRRQKLGTWLMTCLLNHPAVERTHVSLGTEDADVFFKSFGFEWSGAVMQRVCLPPNPPKNPEMLRILRLDLPTPS